MDEVRAAHEDEVEFAGIARNVGIGRRHDLHRLQMRIAQELQRRVVDDHVADVEIIAEQLLHRRAVPPHLVVLVDLAGRVDHQRAQFGLGRDRTQIRARGERARGCIGDRDRVGAPIGQAWQRDGQFSDIGFAGDDRAGLDGGVFLPIEHQLEHRPASIGATPDGDDDLAGGGAQDLDGVLRRDHGAEIEHGRVHGPSLTN